MELKPSLILSTCLALSGCTGTPYQEPEVQMPVAYSEFRLDQISTEDDCAFLHWWEKFNDPFLNALLEDVLDHSFDLSIALEQVYQARAQYRAQFTQILPEFDFDMQGSRFRTSQAFDSLSPSTDSQGTSTTEAATASAVSPFRNFFQLGFDAIWEIDLFGRLQSAARASYDRWEASAENAYAVRIIVLSEAARTYASICALQEKNALARELVQVDEEQLALSTDRFESGLANEQEAESYKAALEASRSAVSLNEIALKQEIYSLAVLLGKEPECVVQEFQIAHPIPYAEGMIPIGIPGDLLRRRPDIRVAERELAAAAEEVWVAVADLLPRISLIGSSSSFAANPLQGANIGWTSDRFSKLLTSSSHIWGIGGLITWPIFDFGKRQAVVDLQVSLKQQAYIAYQRSVIAALQEVEQALAAYFNEEERMLALMAETEANKRIFELQSDQFSAGIGNYTTVLQAKAVWISSLNALADSRQALASDLIAVYKALGGDW